MCEKKLRKCKFKIYGSNRNYTYLYGYFHEFGVDYEEFENGAVNYTVGIVEDIHGIIHMPVASDIQFLPDDFEHPELRRMT